MKFDLLIIYREGPKKIVKGVVGYGLTDDNKIFYYFKNNYRSFVPADTVVFFGRLFDYENE